MYMTFTIQLSLEQKTNMYEVTDLKENVYPLPKIVTMNKRYAVMV